MLKPSLIAVFPLTLLTACGGSGSDPLIISPSSYTPASPQTGDTYTYQRTITPSGTVDGTLQDSVYERVTATDPTGAFYLNGTDLLQNYPYQLDAKRNILSQQNCKLSPTLNAMPTPWYVGEATNLRVSGACAPYSSYQIQQNTTVQSYETISVPAGTFRTLKVQTNIAYDVTPAAQASAPFSDLMLLAPYYTPANVPLDPSSLSTVLGPIYSYTDSQTCWYDVITGFPVQCQGKRKYNNLPTNLQVALGNTLTYAKQLTRITRAANAPFTLTGRDNSGYTLPWLNLTPGQSNGYRIQSGSQITLDTTQPVTWTVSKTESGTNPSVINIPVTSQTSATRLIIASQRAASSAGNQANVSITATLIADPSQNVSFNLTILP